MEDALGSINGPALLKRPISAAAHVRLREIALENAAGGSTDHDAEQKPAGLPIRTKVDLESAAPVFSNSPEAKARIKRMAEEAMHEARVQGVICVYPSSQKLQRIVYRS